MSNVLEYKGYYAKVQYSVEDNILYGTIEGIVDLVDFSAETTLEIESAFHEAVDDYLEFCKEVGKEPDKEFRGTFNVRLDPQVHKQLYLLSIAKGISLNQVVQTACSEYCTRAKQEYQPNEDAIKNWMTTASDAAAYYQH